MISEPDHTGWTLHTLKILMDERFDALDKALALQAEEYERRLTALNHAHDKAVQVQHTYVTQDKFEDRVATDQEKLETALLRTDEKFQDYLKRYEARQREVDLALGIADSAAKRAQEISEEQGRKANRNIAIATLVLGIIVAGANWIPSI